MSKYSDKQKKKLRVKHPFGDARDNSIPGEQVLAEMAAAGRRKEKHFNYNSTMPPRQRDGQTYAGGRHLRRQMAKLAEGQNHYAQFYQTGTRGAGKGTVGEGYMTKPGSMNL